MFQGGIKLKNKFFIKNLRKTSSSISPLHKHSPSLYTERGRWHFKDQCDGRYTGNVKEESPQQTTGKAGTCGKRGTPRPFPDGGHSSALTQQQPRGLCARRWQILLVFQEKPELPWKKKYVIFKVEKNNRAFHKYCVSPIRCDRGQYFLTSVLRYKNFYQKRKNSLKLLTCLK